VRDDVVPHWSDVEAQREYVYNQIEGWPLWRPYTPHPSEQERAVEAALRGEPEQLAALILQPNPQLEPDTWKLVAEFVKGERNPLTGRRKGEVGRPPESKELLRENSAVHEAAEYFFIIREVLARNYPLQSKANIRDRAMFLAAEPNITQETLENYLNLPKRRRRLPYRILGYEEE
jgi:hypothetical protein